MSVLSIALILHIVRCTFKIKSSKFHIYQIYTISIEPVLCIVQHVSFINSINIIWYPVDQNPQNVVQHIKYTLSITLIYNPRSHVH